MVSDDKNIWVSVGFLQICSLYYDNMFMHGTVIRTRITCKKISCYMRGSACRWLIAKYFKIMLNIF